MSRSIQYNALVILICFFFSAVGKAQSVYPGQHKGKIKVENVGRCEVECFDLNDVKLLPGRVHDNQLRDSAWIKRIDVDRLLHSFKNNAGVYAGLEGGYESVRKYGGWESLDSDLRGHTTGHLMSALGLIYASTGDKAFKIKGDSIVAGLAEVQEALGGGYLSAFPEELINRNIKGQRVWAPWYTLHKIMAGLIDQYLYCDNELALAVASRMGEWAYNKVINLPEDTRRLMLRNEFGGMNEAFYNLYSVTADERFKELAEFFYHNDSIDPLREKNSDFGTKHTNTFIPKVIGEARAYELTGSVKAGEVADFFWDEMTKHHCFATGSLSQKEHFFDPSEMSRFINGYTGETCCTYNMLKLARHEFCRTGNSDVVEYMERALFNHILGQQDPETGMVCYFLPLQSGAFKVYSTPEDSFWCCVGSGFENHAKYAENIYFHKGDELLVNLFIPSRLEWKEKGLTIEQLTDFPESENVTLKIVSAPADKTAISLRNPDWCGNPVVKVNGKKVKFSSDDKYIRIDRKWKRGDVIEAVYPMGLQVETTPDNNKRGALRYGPIILCGNLGRDGMDSPAPFSDPTVRNDYYTYDYKIPEGLPTSLKIEGNDLSKSVIRQGKSLKFTNAYGVEIIPLYDAHQTRYVVYWDIEE